MDRLWHLKFFSMIPIPGNQVSAYFDDGDVAQKIIDRHAAGLAVKPQESCETIVFDDLLGHHCFRPDFFPYAALFEMGVADEVWKKIEDKIKTMRLAVGVAREMGFKQGEQKKEGE